MAGRWLFLIAYAASGFAGLVYEVSWTRLATLYLGHTTAAASTVVAAFMGGLALGSAVTGRIAARIAPSRALWMYVALEGAVAVLALLLPWELRGISPILGWAYADGAPTLVFVAVRLFACLVLFTIPAVALGATFPMAVRWLESVSASSGRSAGALYAANTIGAATGALAAGFVLLPSLGILRTVAAGIGASVIAIAAVMLVIRSQHQPETTDAPAKADTRPASHGESGRESRRESGRESGRVGGRAAGRMSARAGERKQRRETLKPQHASTPEEAGRPDRALAAAVLGLTGFATLTYEIAWARVFALTAGPSTYAFAATLAAVIVGLAVGSVVGSAIGLRTSQVRVALAAALTFTAGAAALAGAFAGGALPRAIAEGLARSPAGVGAVSWLQVTSMAGLIVPTAIGLGLSFPLALQLAAGADREATGRLGTAYAVNTVCAVVGSLATGFVAIPWLGLQQTLMVGTGALLFAALVVVFRSHWPRWTRLAGALPALGVAVWLPLQTPWDRTLLASGVYKYTPSTGDHADLAAVTAGSLVYYRDGAAATVSVKRLTGVLSLSVDGKVDASNAGDMLTQKTLAHLPLLLHPKPERVNIIGLGSGITLASVLLHPVSAVDVVEISPQVVEASRLFEADNHHALDDPRTHLILGDGRSHLALTRSQYDVIISEPSNPWMAGVAALFTREFLEAARARLTPGGILCQWAHTYSISDADLRSIVATFRSVFPNGTLWLMGDGDLLMVGTNATEPIAIDQITSHWTRAGVAADLRTVSADEPFALLSSFVGGAEAMTRYAGSAPLQSDDRMALEFSAPFALYEGGRGDNADALRALLDKAQAPRPIAQAWASAGALQRRHRAEMLFKTNAYQSAYAEYVAALALDANDADTPDGLVRAAVGAHRELEALATLEAAARQHRSAIGVHVAWSKLLAATGNTDKAIDVARDAAGIEPMDLRALEQLASIYTDLGDATGLNPATDALRRFFPDSRGAAYYTAASQFLRADLAAATMSVQRAIAVDPNYPAAHNLRGAIAASQGRTPEARAAFQEAQRLDPRDPVTYVNLGLLELSSGNQAIAAAAFAEALSLDPTSASARQGLAEARQQPARP